VIENEIPDELCWYLVAGVSRCHMKAVGSLVEDFTGFVGGFGLAHDLLVERPFDNIADDRAGMTVRWGRLPWVVADLDNRHPKMAAIQSRQSMGECDSVLWGLASGSIPATCAMTTSHIAMDAHRIAAAI